MALFASNNIALGEGVDVFAEYHNQLAAGTIAAIDGLAIPKTESAVGGAYRYAFLHWGLGTWAAYSLVGITLAFFSYRRGLPLTIRSGLSSLFGRSMEGPWGSVVDIAEVFQPCWEYHRPSVWVSMHLLRDCITLPGRNG